MKINMQIKKMMQRMLNKQSKIRVINNKQIKMKVQTMLNKQIKMKIQRMLNKQRKENLPMTLYHHHHQHHHLSKKQATTKEARAHPGLQQQSRSQLPRD